MLNRSRLLPAVLIAAALVPAAAAHAAGTPKTETATAGAVTATFSYTDAGDGKWTGLKVQVTRAAAVAFDGAPTVDGCEEPYCAPIGGSEGKGSLNVTDLDGDGEPEVLVDLYTGGAHCCVVTQVLRWTGSGYATVVRNWADPGYSIQPPAGPGQPATFVTADARFAYAFTAYAFSGFPPRLLTFDHGTWHDVTRQHPDTVRADAARQRKDYLKSRKQRTGLGYLAAWVADEYLLGQRAKADAFLTAELRAGRLKGDAIWPGGKKYISTLKRRLKAWGYTKA